jgi:hypothetical protein
MTDEEKAFYLRTIRRLAREIRTWRQSSRDSAKYSYAISRERDAAHGKLAEIEEAIRVYFCILRGERP